MTEQGPRPIDLTNQANPLRLNVRGDIFMSEGGEGSKPDLGGAEFRQRLRGSRLGRMAGFRGRPQETAETPPAVSGGGDGGGNEPPAPPASPPGGEDGNGSGEQNPQREQPSASEREDATHEPEDHGSPSSKRTKPSIFDELPGVTEKLTEGEIHFLRETGAEEDAIKVRGQQRKAFQAYIDALRRTEKANFFDPVDAYNQLNEAVRRGDVSVIDAERFLDLIAAKAPGIMEERLKRQTPEEKREMEEIEKITDKGERRERLKRWIEAVSPDLTTIEPRHMRLIAEDQEAAELFLDKIISKPFSAPEDGYRLSFYADINLSGFLTELYAIDRQRHTEFVRMKETSLRFHEMNRTIISESGNPDAFLSISRSVTPWHLQTATKIEGVERVRQLIELAYGRLYARTNRLREEDFEPEILAWVTKRFYEEAGYKWSEQEGRWEYGKGEIHKSKFLNADGTQKPMEDWEIQRAIAFGRNITSAFYRHSELISWSNIPMEWEEWLKSMPSETVVRTLGGLKVLAHRFRIGAAGAGPFFTRLIYDKIQKKYKGSLKKIGKLDVAEDLIPTGFFKAGGFDKGWRTFIAYLDTDATRIVIPNPDVFPEAVRESVREFIAAYGNNVTLYDFLIKQEFSAQLASAVEAEIAGVKMPKELGYVNSKEQAKLVEQVLLPLKDQINLSLGVLISFGSSSENIKKMLWEKAADFLPLTVAYKLSEEGVRGLLDSFIDFKGEGETLFKEEFESKLMRAQYLRTQEQKRVNTEVSLDRFFKAAGLTDEEIEFVRALQTLGREKAGELAKVPFPHIPFLDDVPFQKANYIDLGAEVFPRRIGGDFRAYLETNSIYNTIAGNLSEPFEDVIGNIRKLEDTLSGPEGPFPAQDVAFPIIKSWLELAKQWRFTRLPLVKPILEFVGEPTSEFQKFFGRKSPSLSPSSLNDHANYALAKGVIRRERLPGEDASQINEVLKSIGGAWQDVLKEHSPKAVLFFLVTMLLEFFNRIREEK